MAKKKNNIEDTVPVDDVVSHTISPLEEKYNNLIEGLKPKLMSKSAIKKGGANARSRYEAEKGYMANIEEINEIGKKLGKPDIGLGHLRG